MKQFKETLAFISFVTVTRSNIIDCTGKKDNELHEMVSLVHHIPCVALGMGISFQYIKRIDEIVNMFMYYLVNHGISKAIDESVKICNSILDEYGAKHMSDVATMTMLVKKMMGGIK